MCVFHFFRTFLYKHQFAAITDALLAAIKQSERGDVISPHVKHQRIAAMYKWSDVTDRTLKVYALAVNGRISTWQGFKKLAKLFFLTFNQTFCFPAAIGTPGRASALFGCWQSQSTYFY